MTERVQACAVAIASILSACAGLPEVDPAPEPVPVAEAPEESLPAPVGPWAPVLESEREWIEAVKARLPSTWASYEPDPHVVLLYDRKVRRERIREMGGEVLRLLKDVAVPAFPPSGPLDRVFLVRVCRDAGQFAMYGGPPGSAGYWSPRDGESVTFEDASSRRDTLRTVRCVAMMQYLYLSGAPGTHPWFRAGVSAAFSDRGRGTRPKPHPRLSGALGRYFAAHRDRLAALGAEPSLPPHRASPPEETLGAARAAGLEAAFGSLEEKDWALLEKEWNRAR